MKMSNEYHREYQRKRYEQRLDKAKQTLGSVCSVCGTTENLQFDHVDPSTKLFNITAGTKYNETIFLAELAKCQLLCEFHHIEKSKLEGDFGGGHNKIDLVHGTMHCYQTLPCRCGSCKKAGTLYRKGETTYHQIISL